MRAGRLRHRVKLLEQRRMPDGAGGYAEQWVELRGVWVEISMPSGRVAPVAEQLQALVSAEILARPAADLIPGRRLEQRGATYLIEAALPNNERSMLRLLCSNVTPTPR